MDLSERRADMARRHPWEQARAILFRRILRTADLGGDPIRVLDVGAGDGWLAGQLIGCLPAGSHITCWDTAYTDVDLQTLPGSAPDGIRFTRDAPGEPSDLLLCLDVAEHVEDDVAFMRSLVHTHLHPGGLVLASVPAWQSLYSSHDAALRHHRRYAPARFRRLLEQSGVAVQRDGGMFSSLLVPRAASALLERRRGRVAVWPSAGAADDVAADDVAVEGVGAWTGGPVVTSILTEVLAADGAIGERASRLGLRLPGLSHWVFGSRR